MYTSLASKLIVLFSINIKKVVLYHLWKLLNSASSQTRSSLSNYLSLFSTYGMWIPVLTKTTVPDILRKWRQERVSNVQIFFSTCPIRHVLSEIHSSEIRECSSRTGRQVEVFALNKLERSTQDVPQNILACIVVWPVYIHSWVSRVE